MPINTPATPKIAAAQIKLLENLTDACAVSGDEGEVRKIVLEQIRPHVDEVKVDALGNVLASKFGRGKNRLQVMLAAHMDEVGFMLVHDEGDGLYRFTTVGGMNARKLAGKSIWIGTQHVPGVIGLKPIHLTTIEERKRPVSLDSLRIDVSPAKKNEVKVGDRATFSNSFARMGSSLRAKALDDRLGVTTLIELLKNSPTNIDLLAAFTVQVEIGLRGAGVATYALDPQIAIVLDSTSAIDLPTWDNSENTSYNTRLGMGPAIYLANRATLSDPRLIKHLVDSAEEKGIPYQFRQPGRGGTDAGAVHQSRVGVPSVSISVPIRYPHSPASIARIADWKNTVGLVYTALTRLTPDILANDR